MKKPKPRTAKPDIDLNRWCIEMAMKWPVVTNFNGPHGVYSQGGGLPSQQVDADVIGRATKIKAWVGL